MRVTATSWARTGVKNGQAMTRANEKAADRADWAAPDSAPENKPSAPPIELDKLLTTRGEACSCIGAYGFFASSS
jgi:hypothetical protein